MPNKNTINSPYLHNHPRVVCHACMCDRTPYPQTPLISRQRCGQRWNVRERRRRVRHRPSQKEAWTMRCVQRLCFVEFAACESFSQQSQTIMLGCNTPETDSDQVCMLCAGWHVIEGRSFDEGCGGSRSGGCGCIGYCCSPLCEYVPGWLGELQRLVSK